MIMPARSSSASVRANWRETGLFRSPSPGSNAGQQRPQRLAGDRGERPGRDPVTDHAADLALGQVIRDRLDGQQAPGVVRAASTSTAIRAGLLASRDKIMQRVYDVAARRNWGRDRERTAVRETPDAQPQPLAGVAVGPPGPAGRVA